MLELFCQTGIDFFLKQVIISFMDTKLIVKKAGGCTVVGRALGLTKQAVSQWQRVPAEHVWKVSQMSGIPAWKIRRDVFPKEGFVA